MALSEKFKKKLTNQLKKKLNKFHISEFKEECEKVIYGYNSIAWDYQILFKTSNIRFIIEIERLRPDPIHNLVKTLIWLDEQAEDQKTILLHIFDISYSSGDEPNKRMCEFVHERIKKHFKNLIYCTHSISGLSEAAADPAKSPMKPVCDRISDVSGKLIRKNA